VRVHHWGDAATFLERTAEFRSAEPYLTNVMGSVATSLTQGPSAYLHESFWTIEDDRGVRGMMMHTAPHKLTLSPMSREAIATAAGEIARTVEDLPGVSGPRGVVTTFVDDLLAHSPVARVAEMERGLFLYALGTLREPAAAPGVPRVATDDDFALVHQWLLEFARDTDGLAHGVDAAARTMIEQKRVFLWSVGARPVCLVGHSIPMGNAGSVVRVGPVYTPEPERRRGYAGQLTADVSRRLLERGHSLMLFTDADNPTSNGVYARLGYERIDELVECALRSA